MILEVLARYRRDDIYSACCDSNLESIDQMRIYASYTNALEYGAIIRSNQTISRTTNTMNGNDTQVFVTAWYSY